MERRAYAALATAIEPLVVAHLMLRRWRNLEHPTRWKERLGYPSLPRPPGALIWFHAVSLGEGLAAIPIITKCLQMQPLVNILLTTGTLTAFYTLRSNLPQSVLCQFAPVDTPAAVDRFLTYWSPEAGIFMESELWPNLLLSSFSRKIPMALLNARMSEKSFNRWSHLTSGSLVGEMLGNFSLICSLSTKEAVRLQLLGASPSVIYFVGNTKYAWGAFQDEIQVEEILLIEFSDREVWLAASTHAGEEEVIARVHTILKKTFPKLLTIIAPRHPSRARTILTMLQRLGLKVAQRSINDHVSSETDIYLADTIGELNKFYSSVPVAFVGGSLLRGFSGHNLAEAAACGCAVLTGPYLGHFSKMLKEMQSISPLSIHQVFSEDNLASALKELIKDPKALQLRREAAKSSAISAGLGVVQRVYSLLEQYVFRFYECSR